MKTTRRLDVHDIKIYEYLIYRSGIKYNQAHWDNVNNTGWITFYL